jgi:transcriptional regulator with PAS, ATPase and Fis domain
MKILLSWIAFNNDFEQGMVNEDGPTVSFHRHFYQYDQHWLLSTQATEDLRLTHLITHLRQSYPDRTIQPVYLNIRDVIDLSEIKPKIERLLVENSEHEMDIFISPGTPTMQVAWYLCHGSLGLKTKLLQTRAPKFTRSAKPELVEVHYETSSVPLSVMVREKQLNTKPDHQILETETMKPVYQRAFRIAQADGITTLILGATGTGKEHLARYIHANSARHAAAFVSVNCSAFTDSLLESRLFGHKKGSFTGADADHQGFFEQAEGGTLFLDEIGDISPYMQQTLLRVLQEKEIMPIGGKSKKVNVRVIAATHRHLHDCCEKGTFRWDLYYRLTVAEIRLPSLAERGQADIEALVHFFLKTKAREFTKKKPLILSKEVKETLLVYSFPGNVRELENMVSGWYVFCDETVTVQDLSERFFRASTNESLRWKDVEKAHLQMVLQLVNGNKRKAVQLLGYGSMNTLVAKMKEYLL